MVRIDGLRVPRSARNAPNHSGRDGISASSARSGGSAILLVFRKMLADRMIGRPTISEPRCGIALYMTSGRGPVRWVVGDEYSLARLRPPIGCQDFQVRRWCRRTRLGARHRLARPWL